jgi:hypothetical protein
MLMSVATVVSRLADRIAQMETDAQRRTFWLVLCERAYETEGAERMFLLERNARLATELRERGIDLWDSQA